MCPFTDGDVVSEQTSRLDAMERELNEMRQALGIQSQNYAEDVSEDFLSVPLGDDVPSQFPPAEGGSATNTPSLDLDPTIPAKILDGVEVRSTTIMDLLNEFVYMSAL